MLDTEEYLGLTQLRLFLGWQAIEWVFKEMVELASMRNCQLLNSYKEMLLQRLNFLGRENMKKLKRRVKSGFLNRSAASNRSAELEKKCDSHASVLLQVESGNNLHYSI